MGKIVLRIFGALVIAPLTIQVASATPRHERKEARASAQASRQFREAFGGSGTYVGIDPKLDMIYILMEQTEKERGRIREAFRNLVYDAFYQESGRPPGDGGER